MAPSQESPRVLKQGMHHAKGEGKKSPKEAKAADAPKASAPKYKSYGKTALAFVLLSLACFYPYRARRAGNVVGSTTTEVAKSLPENVLEVSESKPELTEAKDLVDENDQSKEDLQETCGVDACCQSLAVSVYINRCLRLIRRLAYGLRGSDAINVRVAALAVHDPSSSVYCRITRHCWTCEDAVGTESLASAKATPSTFL
jgi:hypothetical protein